ncbi:MAG: hypothetical protein M3Y87_25805 [Myxococcota bacterium]|nr:hypothetical protein [Myxococcota bacterium]
MSPPQEWGGGAPPGGGGGFGAAPGGGGFGTPPPSGGGFGTPPPGGGGEAPLGRIPFSPDDEKNITQTALFMRVAGGLALVNALFSMVSGVGVGLYRGSAIASGICGGAVMLGIQALLAVLLFMSSNAFARIVTTDGEDQSHLASGLKQLRVYFMVKAVLWVLGILACCVCVGFVIVLGAAAAAEFHAR